MVNWKSSIQHPSHVFPNVWEYGDDWAGWAHGSYSDGCTYCIERLTIIPSKWGESPGTHYLLCGVDCSCSSGTIWQWVSKQYTFANTVSNVVLSGRITPSDTPGGRWIKVRVNGTTVWQVTSNATPPGNVEQFWSVIIPFTPTTSPLVYIENGQSPAWGPYFYLYLKSIYFT